MDKCDECRVLKANNDRLRIVTYRKRIIILTSNGLTFIKSLVSKHMYFWEQLQQEQQVPFIALCEILIEIKSQSTFATMLCKVTYQVLKKSCTS